MGDFDNPIELQLQHELQHQLDFALELSLELALALALYLALEHLQPIMRKKMTAVMAGLQARREES